MKKILIAEDDEELLKTYRKLIENAGFQVIEARDGEEVLVMVAAEKPHVIILDIEMPKKDGLEVLKELRSTDGGDTVPIIVLTAKDVDEARLQAIAQWKPAYYLVKGNTSSVDLISKIEEIIAATQASDLG